MKPVALFLLAFSFVLDLHAQTPSWIWHPETNSSTVYFRRSFRTPPLTWNARLTLSADDEAEVFLNGVSVGRCSDPRSPLRGEVSVRLNQGENVIGVKAGNKSGAAGLLVLLNLNGQTNLVSDSTWLASDTAEANWAAPSFNAAHWVQAKTIGELGIEPWGDVFFRASATPADNLKVAEGFKVELLHSAAPDEGSWICMTFDDRGRLVISPQGDNRPLLRVNLQDGKVSSVEKMDTPIRYAMGMLYAFDSFYANARGPQGAGLYRLMDTNRNDRYETNEVKLLSAFKGESEHGYHALALGPDNLIYVLNGNGTKLPAGLSADSPYAHYAEDALTGNRGDEEGEDGTKAPNCHVLQTDAEGRVWKLWAGGMRNAYDMDFNEDGELFAFDSDMEWDWGTAWYRPTRVLHVVSGGEYGWRDGTRMWPEYYPDSLPTVAYTGIGSPTGAKFGTKSHFPEKYRRALFALDWSYGRIFAVHLNEKHSSYTGQCEIFLQGTPLNLTSLAFGPDGGMYFITGGRGTQSGLYRVSALKPEKPGKSALSNYAAVRKTRHQLEAFHGETNPGSLQEIYDHLYSANDPFIAHAARVALENQPVELWKRDALLAKNGLNGPLSMLLALARVGGPGSAVQIVSRIFDLDFISPQSLRIIEVVLARYGDPSPELKNAMIERLSKAYPSRDSKITHELCRILLSLDAPGAVQKTIRLLQDAETVEEQMFYAEQLRNVRQGWTIDDRRAYFSWFTKVRDPRAHPPQIFGYFKDAGRTYVDGAYFDRYLRDFRRQSGGTLTADESLQLEPLLLRPLAQSQTLAARERPFVREWKMADLAPDLAAPPKPNLQRGRQALADAQCLSCHRFGNDGGMAAPELTGVGSKYTARDILESIIEPSKVLSDQYQNHTVLLKDGDSLSGRLISDSEKEVILETDRLSGVTEKIPHNKVAEVKPSPLSPMPEGLVNVLTKEEILDLVAYLRAATPARP